MEDKIIIALIAGISAAICGGVSSYAVGLLLWKRTRQPSFWRVPIANADGDGDVKKNPHRGYTINVDQVLYVSGGVQTLKEGAQVEPTMIHFANGEKLVVEGGDNPLFQGLLASSLLAREHWKS